MCDICVIDINVRRGHSDVPNTPTCYVWWESRHVLPRLDFLDAVSVEAAVYVHIVVLTLTALVYLKACARCQISGPQNRASRCFLQCGDAVL